VTVGALTTWSLVRSVRVFGMRLVPMVSTFFDSWKSEDAKIAWRRPFFRAGAAFGSGMTARPESGS
jgi:hypothetical protein